MQALNILLHDLQVIGQCSPAGTSDVTTGNSLDNVVIREHFTYLVIDAHLELLMILMLTDAQLVLLLLTKAYEIL